MGRSRKEFDLSEAKRLFTQTGSWRRVGKILGVHPQSIKNRLEPLGLKTKQSVGRMKTWDVKEAARMKKEGKTYIQIGEYFNVSASTIWRGLKGEGA